MDFCLNCGCWWNRVFLCRLGASYSGSGVCFSLFSRLFVFHPSWRIVVLLCRPPPRCAHISITHIPAYVGPSSEYVRTCDYNTLPECRLASPKTDSAVPTALLTELLAQPDELFATRDGIQGAHFIDKYGHIHYLDRHTLECALSRYGHTEEVAWRRTTILHDGWKTPFLIHFKKHTPKRLSRGVTISRQGGAETHP